MVPTGSGGPRRYKSFKETGSGGPGSGHRRKAAPKRAKKRAAKKAKKAAKKK
jgi:hypothetical protein